MISHSVQEGVMELLDEILETLNNDQNLNSTNIVEKIQQEFQRKMDELYSKWNTCKQKYQLCEREYKAWQKNGFSLDHKFDSGILLYVAAENRYFNIVKYLKDRGANIDIQNQRGYSALHKAVEDGHKETVQFLLKNGAKINAKTKDSEETPLHLAVQHGNMEIIELLIQNKAYVNATNKHGSPPLGYAVGYRWDVHVARLLIENEADVNFQNRHGYTPLHDAANNGNTDIVELLIENGAILDFQNEQGDAPLHRAVMTLQLDTIKLLVAKGAEINIKNNEGHAPLHTAAHHLSERTILAMIELGADPWQKDHNGTSPVDHYVYRWKAMQSRYDGGFIEQHPGQPGYLMKLKQAYRKELFVRYSMMVLGTIATIKLSATARIRPDTSSVIGLLTMFTAAAFALGRVTYKALNPGLRWQG